MKTPLKHQQSLYDSSGDTFPSCGYKTIWRLLCGEKAIIQVRNILRRKLKGTSY
eukprot:TRINITY_DN8884_c0_g1_i1.p1 TRINITY_DN8884_c0_g1~~TRINITY_DN8884_c0_g1_i1.p1  ORF type:complete len:54 (-),score=9.61 TRINITY_DN8884_c0_g1_i1:28-189(-)